MTVAAFVFAAVAVLAAVICAAGWRRTRRAWRNDVKILGRALAASMPPDYRPPRLRVVSGGKG